MVYNGPKKGTFLFNKVVLVIERELYKVFLGEKEKNMKFVLLIVIKVRQFSN